MRAWEKIAYKLIRAFILILIIQLDIKPCNNYESKILVKL